MQYNNYHCFKMLTTNQLTKLISKSVGEKVNLKSTATKIENWDSLAQLNILSSLDKLTKGKSSKLEKLSSADSVDSIIKILSKAKLIKK